MYRAIWINHSLEMLTALPLADDAPLHRAFPSDAEVLRDRRIRPGTWARRMQLAAATDIRHLQPPVVLHGIDGRYATALFTAAQKSNAVDKVEADLNSIKELMDRDAKFKFFLETPIISREAKKQGVKAAMAKGGFGKITSNFFETLADNGRLDQTPKIVTAYAQLLMAARGQVVVTVTSAKVRRTAEGRVRTLWTPF